uniref:Zinc transporter ZIP9 n=1 Tax=Aceria tosichella TaxID=561515 RepID=A0A6G1S3L9_9ACAR
MGEVYLLWFLSISMLVCSFISGLVPMAFKLSDNKSRLLALLGSGILVGTALAIIIPEGIDSLYGQRNLDYSDGTRHDSLNHVGRKDAKHNDGKLSADDDDNLSSSSSSPNHDQPQAASLLQNSDPAMTWTIGVSLIVGFVLMLIIDQFSIYQSGGGHHHHHHSLDSSSAYEIFKSPRQGNYSLASQDDDIDIGMEEDDRTVIDGSTASTSETKPIKNSDSHNIMMRTSATAATTTPGIPESISTLHNTELPTASNNISNPNRYYDHSRRIVSNYKLKNTKVTPTLGLVIHAAADGIALGAAATTSHRDVEMIIFLAIMLHKAPAAFSLVVLLLHNGLKPPTIRKHLLAFSLSAPIAAIVTYYGLSQQGKEALRRNNATGVAMLFSAGTFLFVATVHVLPELIQNKLLTPKELLFLLGGAFLPLILAQTI